MTDDDLCAVLKARGYGIEAGEGGWWLSANGRARWYASIALAHQAAVTPGALPKMMQRPARTTPDERQEAEARRDRLASQAEQRQRQRVEEQKQIAERNLERRRQLDDERQKFAERQRQIEAQRKEAAERRAERRRQLEEAHRKVADRDAAIVRLRVEKLLMPKAIAEQLGVSRPIVLRVLEKHGIPSRVRWAEQAAPKRDASPAPPVPAVEIELEPTEQAPDGGGNAQSAGVRPSTPFARAVDHNRAGDTWKRQTPARPVRYCKCGMALPSRLPERCGECGRPIAQ